LNEVAGLKCFPTKGKISSMVLEWEDKEKKKQVWNLVFGSSKIMNDWVGLINSIISNSYSK
jgi:hypothetical protein